jgi:hypothetical protein
VAVERNEFFREIALRLCGSLDVEKSLWECLLYVRGALPADEILVMDYDENAGLAKVPATADSTGGLIRSVKVEGPSSWTRWVNCRSTPRLGSRGCSRRSSSNG